MVIEPYMTALHNVNRRFIAGYLTVPTTVPYPQPL